MTAEKLLELLMQDIKNEMKSQKIRKYQIAKTCGWSKNTTTSKFKRPETILAIELIKIIELLQLINPLYYKGGE